MATPDHRQGQLAQHNDEGNASNAQAADHSRLEHVLTKSPAWKKQTLSDIEAKRIAADALPDDRESKTARVVLRLSAQIEERNDEIERLREALSRLESEKSRQDREHRREIARHRTELERMQDAYDQFERESDSMLSELGQQNDRLRRECRRSNGRSLLK